ncbi:hypothetical protein ACQPYE_17185 [Actinosynnema sp. CA-299493]
MAATWLDYDPPADRSHPRLPVERSDGPHGPGPAAERAVSAGGGVDRGLGTEVRND